MNEKNSNTYMLQSLVSNFEVLIDRGEIGNFNKEEFLQLINFYKSKNNIEKALEIADLAIEQFKYITNFYLVKSSLLLEIKKPVSALEIINYCENISPYAYEVKLIKAKALSMNGDIEKVLSLLEELKTFSNLNNKVELFLIKSYVFGHAGEYDEMFNVLKEALVFDPQNKEALERINTATTLTKKYEESILFHSELIDDNPYNYLAWFNIGEFHTVLSEYEDAIDSLEYSFLINPDFEAGYLEYADLCNQTGNYSKAVTVYEEYIERFEADSELYVNLIQSHIELNNLKKAKKYAFASIKMDSYNDEAYFLLGEIYKKDEKWEKALNAYHKAIEIEDYREEYYDALAEMYMKLGDISKAEKYFDILIEMDTPEEKYYIKYILFLLSNKKYSKAYNIIEKSEDIVYSPLFDIMKSVIYFKVNNKKEGLLVLDSAMTENNEGYKMLFKLAPELKEDKEVASIINYYKS